MKVEMQKVSAMAPPFAFRRFPHFRVGGRNATQARRQSPPQGVTIPNGNVGKENLLFLKQTSSRARILFAVVPL